MSTKTNPEITLSHPEEARKMAAAILGRKGGLAGRGEAKRRSPRAIAKAVKARIAANRLRKGKVAA